MHLLLRRHDCSGVRVLIARTRSELDDARSRMSDVRDVALVPTMGALHEGHLSLVAAARQGERHVVVSIFVNPTQFEADADLKRYPVDHTRDLRLLEDAGADLVWLPDVGSIYPTGHATMIEIGGPSIGFEGEARPGHFRGVATVVAILIGQVRPDQAWFGEKDWQQLQVVRRLVADLCMPVSIRSIETVRAADGLALSSRNRFLGSEERLTAPRLYATLVATASAIVDGGPVSVALERSQRMLQQAGLVTDYVALVRGVSLEPIDQVEPGARLLGAARLGSVRLLDNISLDCEHRAPPNR